MAAPSVRIDRDQEMTTRDGVVLSADVYRPEISAKVPAIVMRTPYEKGNTAINQTRYLPPLTACEAGFAVVVQDIRGRYASEGEWDIVHLHAANVDDGGDCVEWVASEPWCDGNVGMMGGSYVGVTQLAAAAGQPRSLRAIAPWLLGMPADRAMGHSLPLESMTVGWMAGLGIDNVMKKMETGEADPSDLEKLVEAIVDPARPSETLPLSDLLNLQTPGNPSYSEVDEMLVHANSEIGSSFDKFTVPALWCFGWYDNAGGTEMFEQMGREAGTEVARTESRMIIGPWTHNYALDFVGQFGVGGMGSAAGGGVPSSHLKFFSRHLRGEDVDIPVVRYFVMGSNVWKTADDWPIPGTDSQALHLRSGGGANGADGDGRLEREAPTAGERPDTYRYDPMDPVPAWGFRVMYTGGTVVNGPYEQTRVERRHDVLCYTTDEYTAPFEIAGDVVLHLWAASSAVDTDWIVKLCVVDRNGLSTNLADGYLRARVRDDWRTPELMEPGTPYEFTISLGQTAYRGEPGARLRLQVTSSAFPHFARNMNTGNPIHEDAEGIIAEQTILHDPEHPSRVILPVQPAAEDLGAERLTAAMAVLPDMMGG
ncbi:MAG: CocE/NonD family hydrolase [Acidimicrobiia bacterium]|nr:CocE/NonD family hydrolase [Acidimicrobiia bacterium]